MTGPAADAGFLAGPGAVIAGIAGGAEPGLGAGDIAAAVARAAPSRAQQRRLAAALSADPGLLTSGRPEGPPQVELLIRALRENGARRLVLPRCARLRPAPAAGPARWHPADLHVVRSPAARHRRAVRDLREHQAGPCPGPGRPAALRPLPSLRQPRSRRADRGPCRPPRPGTGSPPAAGGDRRSDPPAVPAPPGAAGTGPVPGAAHRPGRARLAAGQRPHPGAAGRRRGRRRGPRLPVLRPDRCR